MKDGRQKSYAQLVVLMGAMSTSGASAVAQILVDPTRPPAGIYADMPDAASPGNELQSVMISPTRRAAIISGVVVELGGKYGDAVLIRVAEDEVVLRRGDSRQVLRLHPAVDKGDVARARRIAPEAVGSAPHEAKPKAGPKTPPEAGVEPNAKGPAGANGAAGRETGSR